jgi:hypothetical protein
MGSTLAAMEGCQIAHGRVEERAAEEAAKAGG